MSKLQPLLVLLLFIAGTVLLVFFLFNYDDQVLRNQAGLVAVAAALIYIATAMAARPGNR